VAEPTTLASWASAIARALIARGSDARQLFLQAGLDYACVDQAEARYPLRRMTRLWALAVEACGDPPLSLQIPQFVQPQTMHALGPALQSSRTLMDALLRTARYSRIVTDAADLEVALHPQTVEVIYRTPVHDVPLADAAYEAFMATAAHVACILSGRRDTLQRIDFRHPCRGREAPYRDHFGCPVRFGSDSNRMVYDRTAADAPLPGGDERRAHRYDAAAAAYLARFDAQPYSQRVREQLIRGLPAGEPTRDTVAAALGLQPRTLLRRLAAEQTNFHDLLNQTRRELALAYLREGRTAADATFLLGFGDPSNFGKAFRRWTGMSPQQWRRRHVGNG
jgi:AraC-like DNA-binding protein